MLSALRSFLMVRVHDCLSWPGGRLHSVTLKLLRVVLSNGPSTPLTWQHVRRAVDVCHRELEKAVSGWFALALQYW